MPRIEGFIKPEEVLDRVGLKQGMKTADLGCGAGFFILPAAKIVGEKGVAYAIDIQHSALSGVEDKAHMEGLDDIVKMVWADLEVYQSTKLPDNTLDLAMLVDVLFQNDKPQEIFKEAKRITKEDGKILIIDWKLQDLPFGPLPNNRISEHKVKELAQDLGLDLLDSWDPSPYHYALVYKK
ncbi:MAG: class I SAM-dependent methyltransferase [Patescibacteria group bacterium]|nr:class I SAM-dependent methyltransferase [Patescibacteria group bacterium]